MITEVTGPSRQRRGPSTCPVKFEEPGHAITAEPTITTEAAEILNSLKRGD